MKRLPKLSVLLAAALQVMPICRTVCTLPTAGSTLAIIIRWTIGASVATGAFDGISGASQPVIFTSLTNFTGTVGVPFTNYVAIANNAEAPGAFFVLTNQSGVSPALFNGNTTIVCMPAGLTFKCYDLNDNVNPPKLIYGAIYGTPTTAVTNHRVHVLVGFSGETPAQTNSYFTILPNVPQAPVITNQPVGITNLAGANATFSVVAGGTAPLAYQWRLFGASVAGATNSLMTLTKIRLSQAGDYSVVITNSVGSITSSVAKLSVTIPPPPVITILPQQGNLFRFSFVPVVGLTNQVWMTNNLEGDSWALLTNIPPPVTASSVTITDVISEFLHCYRVSFEP